MSRFLTGFGAAVLVAVAVYFFAGGSPTGAQEKAAPAVRWEYKRAIGETTDEEFNKLGADGWELATSLTNPAGLPIHTFKRRK